MTRALLLFALVACAGCRDTAGAHGRAGPPGPGALALASLPAATVTTAAGARVQAAQAVLRRDARHGADWVTLGRAFIDLAREASDAGLYAQARDAVERALATDGNDLTALQTE